jgi:ABC-type sulfate transport system permease component
MKSRTRQTFSMITLLLFALSVIPFSGTYRNDTEDLQSAISTIQRLQQTDQSAESSFQTAFTDTLIALQTAAGFTTLFTADTAKQEADTQQILIPVRLPYLLPSTTTVGPDLSIQNLSPNPYQFVTLYYLSAPDTPPPLFC